MAEWRGSAKPVRPCRFCSIVAGSGAAHLVWQDAVCAAFLDYRPLALGHTLLVPAAHYQVLSDVPDRVFSQLAVRVKRLSAAVEAAMAADGIFVALNDRVSQSVPHLHFHVVPRKKGDGLFSHRLIWKRVSYRDEAEECEIAARIRQHLGD